MLLLQRYDCEHKNNCSGEWEQANQVSFLAGKVALSLCYEIRNMVSQHNDIVCLFYLLTCHFVRSPTVQSHVTRRPRPPVKTSLCHHGNEPTRPHPQLPRPLPVTIGRSTVTSSEDWSVLRRRLSKWSQTEHLVTVRFLYIAPLFSDVSLEVQWNSKQGTLWG